MTAGRKVLSRRFTNSCLLFERSKNRLPEILVLFGSMLLMTAVSAFHEPWFDEAQAWLIARSASIRDIILTIPHYEGHTPLWHLILLPLARSRIPYEWGLKATSILLSAAASGLILFKAPFPRLVRMIMPFTFFLFYQYGVISRNYSLMLLAFVLTAACYRTRHNRPVRFVLCLALLAAASSYGIAISAGIALAWLIEIWDRQRIGLFVSRFLHDRRFFSLAGLLVYAVVLVWLILPYDDTMAASLPNQNNFAFRLMYMLLIAPIDAVFFHSSYSYELLGAIKLSPVSLITGLILGLIFILILGFYTYTRKKLVVFILPHMFLAVFSACVYFKPHHLGIVSLLIIFLVWICLEQPVQEQRPIPAFILKTSDQGRELRKMTFLLPLFVSSCLVFSVYWSVVSSYQDIRIKYGYGREAAAFLAQNQLDDLQIMASWSIEEHPMSDEMIVDTNMVSGVDILPYLSTNIISNLNNGDDAYPYLIHKRTDNTENLRAWREMGIPDLLIANPDLNSVYGYDLSINDYIAVKKLTSGFIWKDQTQISWFYLYLRKDLMSSHPGLEEVPIDMAFTVK